MCTTHTHTKVGLRSIEMCHFFQYVFDVPTTKETVMIFLEQKDVKGREAMLQNMNTIGYHILKVSQACSILCVLLLFILCR